MPLSQHSWLGQLFLRLRGRFRQHARKEPEPPIGPYAYGTAPKKPRHRIAGVRLWLSYRKTELVRPITIGKLPISSRWLDQDFL